jgi:hypothetical protein
MGWRRRIAATLLAAALGACAQLTADAPLFSVADQIGLPPLTEGIWITVGEQCPAYYARRRSGRFRRECSPVEIRREQDGAWMGRFRADLVFDMSPAERAEAAAEQGPMRMIIAPAVERPLADGYAPIYVAEIDPPDEGDRIGYISYAVIAPIGAMPATSMLVIGAIGCDDILRDGPIDGVTVSYSTTEPPADEAPESAVPPQEVRADSEPVVSGCSASTQAAVREAARRAVIESIEEMTQVRFVYVRPQ